MFDTVLMWMNNFVNSVVIFIMTKMRKKKTIIIEEKERFLSTDKVINSHVNGAFPTNSLRNNSVCDKSSLKKWRVNVPQLKLSRQQLEEYGLKHRGKRKKVIQSNSDQFPRRVSVNLVQDNSCSIITDRLVYKSKIKVKRIPHSTRWLRPGPLSSDDYGLDLKEEDVVKDSEERPMKEVPAWARKGSTQLRQGLKQTGALDPDLVFALCEPPNLDMMFLLGPKKRNIWSSYSSREGLWEEE